MTAHDTAPALESNSELRTIVASLLEQKASYPLVVGDGKIACKVLGCGLSQLANKRRAGEVPSFLDGAKRVYPIGPLFDHLIRKAIASFSPGGEPLKARHPTGQFTPGHAPPKRTPAQIETLHAGNATRIARARARKAAKDKLLGLFEQKSAAKEAEIAYRAAQAEKAESLARSNRQLSGRSRLRLQESARARPDALPGGASKSCGEACEPTAPKSVRGPKAPKGRVAGGNLGYVGHTR